MSAPTNALDRVAPGTLLGRALATHVALGRDVSVEPTVRVRTAGDKRSVAARQSATADVAQPQRTDIPVALVNAGELQAEWDLSARALAELRDDPTFPEPVTAAGGLPAWDLAALWRWRASPDS